MCLISEYMLVRVYTRHVARVAVCCPPPASSGHVPAGADAVLGLCAHVNMPVDWMIFWLASKCH